LKYRTKSSKKQREMFLGSGRPMQKRVTTINTNRKTWMPLELLEVWRYFLQEQDRSTGTVKKYIQAVMHFLAWYEQVEHAPLSLEGLTPIALIGYRNELQHEQHKSTSTINLRISALRGWCGWMTEQGILPADPAAHIKLIGGEGSSKRSGLKSAQINALLRQAQISRDKERNYAIIQVLLQTGIRLSECATLTFEDLTFGERSGLLRVRAGKGNKARTVPLNASAREALAIYVAPRLGIEKSSLKAVAKSWPKPKSPEAHEPIFLSQKGGALTTSAMGQMIAGIVEASGGLVPEETSAHTLRHTFARSYLAHYPGDVVGLATLLGHSSLDTTRLYCQQEVSQLATRIERLEINAYSS
jgi:site-specific recombinase XerD